MISWASARRQTISLLSRQPLLQRCGIFLAALHQSESVESVSACIHEHLGGDTCRDVLIFALCIALLLLYAIVKRTFQQHLSRPHARRAPDTDAQARRLAAISASTPGLRRFGGRIFAMIGANDCLCTRGLLRPVVEVGTDIMDRLDDSALASALLHEREHAAAFDPLRYMLASASFVLNPLGYLLRPEFRRWHLAREAVCDASAVQNGGPPLSLAEAILVAARPAAPTGSPLVVGIAEGAAQGLRLRIHLLLCYVSTPPVVRWRKAPVVATLLTTLVLVSLPHASDASWLLGSLHAGVESLANLLEIG